MPAKKVKKPESLAWLESAEKLIKKQPREFMIGFLTLSLLLMFFVYLSFFYYHQAQTGSMANKSKKEESPTPTVSTEKYYQLKNGESLWDVAEKELGNPYLYPTLVELNNLSSPDMVEPGAKIRVK